MKHFKILQYEDVDELAEAVEKALNDGWELHGLIFVTPPSMMDHTKYNQAITTNESYKR